MTGMEKLSRAVALAANDVERDRSRLRESRKELNEKQRQLCAAWKKRMNGGQT